MALFPSNFLFSSSTFDFSQPFVHRSEGKKDELKQRERAEYRCQVLSTKLNRNLCLPNYHCSVREEMFPTFTLRHVPENCYLFALLSVSCWNCWMLLFHLSPYNTNMNTKSSSFEIRRFQLSVLSFVEVSTQHICFG